MAEQPAIDTDNMKRNHVLHLFGYFRLQLNDYGKSYL